MVRVATGVVELDNNVVVDTEIVEVVGGNVEFAKEFEDCVVLNGNVLFNSGVALIVVFNVLDVVVNSPVVFNIGAKELVDINVLFSVVFGAVTVAVDSRVTLTAGS